MDYRLLGRSGTVVSTLTLGTMTFGKEADEAASHEIMSAYVEAGGNLFDTADVYSRGVSEEIIGRWLADHPTEAEQVVLATKARAPMGQGPNDLGISRRHLRRALDDSLRRLGVDHIDLYQMHAWDALTPLEETLGFLVEAIAAGKISYYGFSNYLGWQVTKAAYIAAAHGWPAPVTLQPQYNLLVRDIEHEIVPAVQDDGMGLLPWSPLAGGWLTGKYQRDVERTWRTLEVVADIAQAHAATKSQVALAWLTAQPAVTSVIIGARNLEQLRDNLGATDLHLTGEELERLSEVSAPVMDDYPYGPAGIGQRHRPLTLDG